MTDAEKLILIAENERKVHEAGKQAEYDGFWDSQQNYGKAENHDHFYSGAGWNKQTYKPKYNMHITSAYMMFRYFNRDQNPIDFVNDISVVLNFSKCTQFSYTFYAARVSHLGTIDTRSATTLTGTFQHTALTTIDLLIVKDDGSTNIGDAFLGSTQLKHLTIEGLIAKNANFGDNPLAAESLVSIVEHYSTTATGLTLTVKQTAVNNADWSKTNYSSWDELKAIRPNLGFAYK